MPKDIRRTRPSPKQKWNISTLPIEALKYNTRSEFEAKNLGAYSAALKLGVIDEICTHMQYVCRPKYSNEEIVLEALKSSTRVEFKTKSSGAYQAAEERGLLNEVCRHMKASRGSSNPERELLAIVKKIYPSAKKIRDNKVKIEGKPHIHAFEIDIFIPELNKGIEFDGQWHHSAKFLEKYKKKKWPLEDSLNKHQIKDSWFLSKGIEILHVKGQDWLKNRENCLTTIANFLNGEQYEA